MLRTTDVMFVVLFSYNIQNAFGIVMRRVIGFAMFCMAIGIIISFFLKTRFVEVLVVIGLLIIGYNMFTMPCCRK